MVIYKYLMWNAQSIDEIILNFGGKVITNERMFVVPIKTFFVLNPT